MHPPYDSRQEQRQMLKQMRLASFAEATTLAFLVLIAVPLKHLFGMPAFVSILGPVHGLAFVIYIWMLIQARSTLAWSPAETARMVISAFIPLAGFVNERILARQQAVLLQ